MRVKSWTRSELADRVVEAFDFDIERLWAHLQLKGDLPRDLHEDWDPIGGEQGALQYLRHHGSMPVTSGGRAVRKPCKTCGVAKVVLGCLSALDGPELPHALSFVRELKPEIDRPTSGSELPSY
jgi:hypothetical protein